MTNREACGPTILSHQEFLSIIQNLDPNECFHIISTGTLAAKQTDNITVSSYHAPKSELVDNASRLNHYRKSFGLSENGDKLEAIKTPAVVQLSMTVVTKLTNLSRDNSECFSAVLHLDAVDVPARLIHISTNQSEDDCSDYWILPEYCLWSEVERKWTNDQGQSIRALCHERPIAHGAVERDYLCNLCAASCIFLAKSGDSDLGLLTQSEVMARFCPNLE